ncbi:haloacid dehalogenase [Bacillus clarus]|uniref:Haloacid dehalogenase n=1 Tax=Bacillus clarus TaxID=2338372 RepID=A0A090YRZ7_9BACI|nr:HAD hydrolase family protein [Bacillus clarus]KFN01022.1 haloacid dehalogenase-like hydrolase family protein [Bacillus clarus]RFT66812.1 haloacid dehalogenase [Bacillus clarus]
MIFASDFDQTLIYSRKSFRTAIEEEHIQLIETLDGKEISFISYKTISLLKKLQLYSHFIPVTTRTIEQFQHILLFQNEIIPEYVVTSNGGNILHNGKQDTVWKERIQSKISTDCLESDAVLKEFKQLSHEDWIISQKTADHLFHYCIVKRENIPYDELTAFTAWLDKQGWNHSLQGRKLYFVPKPVNKWAAVQYIQDKLQINTIITAGDSLLDLCMLEGANYAFAPLHGELETKQDSLQSHILKTNAVGIYASEEIVNRALQIIQSSLPTS